MSTPTRRRRDASAPTVVAPSGAPVSEALAPESRVLTRRELRALAESPTPVEASAEQVPVADAAQAVMAAVAVAAEAVVADAVDTDGEADAVVDAPQSDADAFEEASRLFATAAPTTPVVIPAATETVEHIPAEALHVAPRRRRGYAKRIAAVSLSVGAVGSILCLSVAMAFPAAPAGNDSTRAVAASVSDSDEGIQAFVASSDVQNTDVERSSNYESVTAAQLAQESGIAYSNSVFTNNPNAAIQWPFAVGTGMSYGYGMRDGRMHEGIDFTPGSGAPIQAIADGVVRTATENGGGYGVTVYIDHVIDGQVVTSHYSHMQYGSIAVTEGQEVKVGDRVGLTGNTGRSFGAHLHFELIVDGHTIDPMPWLQEHAG